jgi:hypothetical protein
MLRLSLQKLMVPSPDASKREEKSFCVGYTNPLRRDGVPKVCQPPEVEVNAELPDQSKTGKRKERSERIGVV